MPIVLTTVLGGSTLGANRIQALNDNPFTDLAQMISRTYKADKEAISLAAGKL